MVSAEMDLAAMEVFFLCNKQQEQYPYGKGTSKNIDTLIQEIIQNDLVWSLETVN